MVISSTCIRPVLMVDIVCYKREYKSIMLVVVSIDANKQVYPMAFGLGDKENDESWMCFMRKLTTIGAVNRLVYYI